MTEDELKFFMSNYEQFKELARKNKEIKGDEERLAAISVLVDKYLRGDIDDNRMEGAMRDLSYGPKNYFKMDKTLLLTMVGMIGAVLFQVGHSVWWTSGLDSRVEHLESATQTHYKDAAYMKDLEIRDERIKSMEGVVMRIDSRLERIEIAVNKK